MPKVIRNISGEILPNYESTINVFSTPIGLIGNTDYIEVFNFIGFVQDFRSAKSIETLQKPLSFGLKNQYGLPIITLEISY